MPLSDRDYVGAMRRWVVGASVLLACWVLWPALTVRWSVDSSAEADLVSLVVGLLLPSALIGGLVNRWWAPTLALVLIALPLIPERCVIERASDYIDHSCSGFSDEVAAAVALAFGALLVGAVVGAFVRARTLRDRSAIEVGREG